jgi:hypothetical protein
MLSISGNFSPLTEFGHVLQQVVMPIVAKVYDRLIPIGTGFVIAPDGLMMTASHVLIEAEKHKIREKRPDGEFYDYYELYALYITNEQHGEYNQYTVGGLWPIDNLWCPNELDIGFCWLRQATRNGKLITFPVVKLSPGIPKVGEQISGFGYYNSNSSLTDEVINSQIKVNYLHDTAFTRGEILEIYPVKRDNGSLKFPCFHTDARFEYGMSGGPIFNQAGAVCGVICYGMPPIEEDPRYISYGSLLWPAMAAQIEVCIDPAKGVETLLIYDLVKKGYISTDETFKNISIVLAPNGERTVSIQN